MSASRYTSCARLSRYDGSGRLITYLAVRILPFGDVAAGSGTARVHANEVHRLDLVAYRTLGDAEQAWRIADANAAMDPFALCERAERSLRLPASML
jgi:hypothetical protein